MHAGVGIVSQESQLFNTTLVDNIRYGAFDASVEEVQRACDGMCASSAMRAAACDPLAAHSPTLIVLQQRRRLACERVLLLCGES